MNPAYSVTVSDNSASRAREKAAKEVDAARLHLVGSKHSGDSQSAALEPVPESIAADALNAIRLGEDPLRNEEKEDDNVEVVGNQSSVSCGNSTGLDLK
jgi:hypothetical protein